MNYLDHEIPKKKPQYMQATGKLPYTLINDYMFKALLQENKNVLKHLVCSLLHLQPEEIHSIKVRNPILLGAVQAEDFDSKTFILDINVLLNDHTLINLEMQVVDYKNWPERAMTYLCRSFDQLQSGQDYLEVKPTIQISFLDFTLFPEHPEFYATYKMMNVKTRHILTDKIALSVVDLKHMDLATQEDQRWKIDYWASLFKATTWEELKMLAEQNPVMGDAVETIFELTADEAIREQCKAREKHIKEMNTILREREMAEKARDVAKQEKDVAEKARDMAEKERDVAKQEKDVAEKERDVAKQERDVAEKERDVAKQERDVAEKERDVAEKERDSAKQAQVAAEKEKETVILQLEQKDQQIAQLLQELQHLKEQQNSDF